MVFGGAGQGVLSKDPTVWVDVNTCIPASFLENAPAQLHGVPTPKKYVCKYKKISIERV
jgi:hypothetical protein